MTRSWMYDQIREMENENNLTRSEVPPTLLITGAAGFVGRNLAIRAKMTGWRVVALLHRTPLPSAATSIETRVCDLSNEKKTVQLIQEVSPDVVVHCAYSKEPDQQEKVIVAGTRGVVAGVKTVGARLIHLSTDLVFCGSQGAYAEEDRPAPLLPYGALKLEAEELVRPLCRAIILRPSLIYDPGEAAPHESFIENATRENRPVTLHGWEFRSPTDRSDLVQAILHLASEGGAPDAPSELFHAGGASSLNRYEFARALAPLRGYDQQLIKKEEAPPTGAARPANCSLISHRLRDRLGWELRGVYRVIEDFLKGVL